jgi:MHS family shikimate/dehydroshikimate transporter-like MFS transporter
VVGLFIRLKVAESPAFAHARETGVHVRQPIVEVLRRYPRQVLLSAGVRFIDTVRGHHAPVGQRW